MKRLAIIGRTEALYNSAELFQREGYKIGAIVTAKASPEYKKDQNDFKEFAEKNNIPFFISSRLNEERILKALSGIDIGISMNWVSIVNQKEISCFKEGVLNAHFGDLPRYRGNACPNWAIINGEEKITLSIHKMEPGKLDCGAVITQKHLPLQECTYIDEIYKWGEGVIPEAFLSAVRSLERDPSYVLKYADRYSRDSVRCYPRRPEDSRIDWNRSHREIMRLIRASSRPLPGAFTYLNGKKFIIWKAEPQIDQEQFFAIPGQICDIYKDAFVVITGNGKLKVTEWQSEEVVKSSRQRLA